MNEIIGRMYSYFTDNSVPQSRKVKVIILAVIAIWLIDNHYGFTHTIINSFKLDYMIKLESAKQ